jgi:hypothetical protein
MASRKFGTSRERRSVTTRLWAIVAAAALALGIAGAALTYLTALADEEASASRSLGTYATERAMRESQRFEDLARLQQLANAAFGQALAAIDPARVDADFDRLFPLAADGTRRSIDALYDGYTSGDGTRLYGIGAFIGDGRNLDSAEKAQLLAALRVVSRFGEGIGFRFDNFYFFTPKNRLVMFAPKRSDRLIFYRREAPPSFSFTFEEMVQITLPASNPTATMRCTSLQHILYDRSFRTWTTGCMTPATVDGGYVGAWGVSLLLDQIIAQSIESRAPGTENMMLTGDGKLIAHRFLTEQGSEKTETYLDIARSGDARLARIANFAEGARRRMQVAYNDADDRYIAAAPLRGPDWRFVVTAHGEEVRARAMKLALKVFGIVVVGAALLLLVLHHLLQTQIALPLRRMLDAFDRQQRQTTDREGLADVLPVKRADEIGAVARRLARVGTPPA